MAPAYSGCTAKRDGVANAQVVSCKLSAGSERDRIGYGAEALAPFIFGEWHGRCVTGDLVDGIGAIVVADYHGRHWPQRFAVGSSYPPPLRSHARGRTTSASARSRLTWTGRSHHGCGTKPQKSCRKRSRKPGRRARMAI